MISQKMIAEKLGMPVSTVTNILNGTPNYKRETRERVLRMAESLGYQPNRASRALKRGRSNLIGVIHFGSPYVTAHQGIHHVVRTIDEWGYDSLVINSHWHEGNNDRVLGEIIQSRVEGVLLIANQDHLPETRLIMDRLKRAGIPIVSLFGESRSDTPLVGGSSKRSFFCMHRHLRQVGHRSVLLVAPFHPILRSVTGRIEGFESAMAGDDPCYNLTEDEFFQKWPRLKKSAGHRALGIVVRLEMSDYGDNVLLRHYDFANQLFSRKALPDAIMCSNDRAAFGVFNAAFESGISIPGDLAVTGCDNEDIGAFPIFRLTSIRFDIASSSKAAVKMLMKLLKKQRLARREITFPGDLVLRRSCGRTLGPDGPEIFVPTKKFPERAKAQSLRKKP